MEETISVIVPIYRVEKYLAQCIESIVNQTYKNLEIILVDDGSDDHCGKICDLYAERDSRIKVIHKTNGGADDARKAGIQAATGTYVGYVDGDDWIEPAMYETLIKIAKDYNVDVVESGVIDTYENVYEYRTPYFPEGCYKDKKFDKIAPHIIYLGDFFEFGIQVYLFTKLYKREKFMKFQMLEDYSNNFTDDVLCTLPAILSLRSIYVSHQCFYHYRVRNGSAKHSVRIDIPEKIERIYGNAESRFENCKKEDNISGQLSYLYMYLLLAKAIYVFDGEEKDHYLRPYGGIHRKNKIVIYGAGAVGMNIMNYVQSINGNVVFWADKNYANLNKELRIGAPEDILNFEFDYLVLAILRNRAAQNAKRQLSKIGIPEKKILWIEPKYINDPKKLLKKAKYKNKYIFKGCD